MEKQVVQLFNSTLTGWSIQHVVTMRPNLKWRIVATFEGIDFTDRKVFTAEVRRDEKGSYLFIDC